MINLSNRSLDVNRSDLLGISEYVTTNKKIMIEFMKGPATLAEKDLVLFPS